MSLILDASAAVALHFEDERTRFEARRVNTGCGEIYRWTPARGHDFVQTATRLQGPALAKMHSDCAGAECGLKGGRIPSAL
jgi:hypothetical protein